MKKLLFVHRSFPGQFRWILPELERMNLDIVFICNEKTNWPSRKTNIIELKADVSAKSIIESGRELSSAVVDAGLSLLNAGWIPDVIYSHSGWGVWKIADIFPQAKLMLYVEWWYTNTNVRYHHWTEKKIGEKEMIVPNLINANTAEGINRADITISPTVWQRKQFPKKLRTRISVLNDGFPLQSFVSAKTISTSTSPRIAFISRGFEATRGIIALSTLIDKIDPSIQIELIADYRCVYDDKSDWDEYSAEIFEKIKTKKNAIISDSKSYDEYLDVLRSSDLHLYLSRPFVLSWSFIESSLVGSKIVSLDNCATFEKTHSNHVNVKTVTQLASAINSLVDKTALDQLRKSNNEWLETIELQEFRKKHCIKEHTAGVLRLLMS